MDPGCPEKRAVQFWTIAVCERREKSHGAGTGPDDTMPKARDGVLARSVCYTRQHTTVFERAPIVSGSAAVLLGNVTNNAPAEIELAVGGVDGRLAVFKAGHSSPGPYFEASGHTSALLRYSWTHGHRLLLLYFVYTYIRTTCCAEPLFREAELGNVFCSCVPQQCTTCMCAS